MSMLNIAKKLNRLNKSKLKETSQRCNCSKCRPKVNSLFEAKADTQRLIDFAGENLANRFLAVKNKLKAPANDLYYWINNKTVDELEQAISTAEGTKSNTQMKKDIADQGAELVADTAHWRVYHITSFEASQKYGRDTKWCITGIDNYGDQYWRDYTSKGVQFYFAIAKENYDPRGNDSKFAFAAYSGDSGMSVIELYDQQDERVSLNDIPYNQEINIPGVDLSDVLDPASEITTCYECDALLADDEMLVGSDGEFYCETCWKEHFFCCDSCVITGWRDDGITTVFGDHLCADCFDDYMESNDGAVQSFFYWAEDGISNFIDTDSKDERREAEEMLQELATAWFRAKDTGRLNLSPEEIAATENTLFNDAAQLGLDFKREHYMHRHESHKARRAESLFEEFKLYEHLWD